MKTCVARSPGKMYKKSRNVEENEDDDDYSHFYKGLDIYKSLDTSVDEINPQLQLEYLQPTKNDAYTGIYKEEEQTTLISIPLMENGILM